MFKSPSFKKFAPVFFVVGGVIFVFWFVVSGPGHVFFGANVVDESPVQVALVGPADGDVGVVVQVESVAHDVVGCSSGSVIATVAVDGVSTGVVKVLESTVPVGVPWV